MADHHQAHHHGHQDQAPALVHLPLHRHQGVYRGLGQDQSLLSSLPWRIDDRDEYHHRLDHILCKWYLFVYQ